MHVFKQSSEKHILVHQSTYDEKSMCSPLHKPTTKGKVRRHPSMKCDYDYMEASSPMHLNLHRPLATDNSDMTHLLNTDKSDPMLNVDHFEVIKGGKSRSKKALKNLNPIQTEELACSSSIASPRNSRDDESRKVIAA